MATTKQIVDFTEDLTEPILWQHNVMPKLLSLVNQKNDWYQANHVQFWTDWITNVFDIRTCNDFGLDVWAQILDFPIYVLLPPNVAGPAFSFGSLNQNFQNGTFIAANYSSITLTTEQKRIILRMRYFQLTMRPSVTNINRMLSLLFSSYGKVYVLDPGNMTRIIYVFTFTPPADLMFIMQKSGALIQPAAVGVQFIDRTVESFGFSSFNKNFYSSNFMSPVIG